MKLRREHVQTLRKRALSLQESKIKALVDAIDNWEKQQAYRERYGSADQETVAYYRARLERQLKQFRTELGEIYDLMSERGMRDVGTGSNGRRT